MNKHTPQHVRGAFEQYIRAYNAHDDQVYWACFAWPHTTVEGNAMVVHAQPTTSLDAIKVHHGWMYQQIVSLQVVAYSDYTAHLVVRLVALDAQKQCIAEYDLVLIYKKIKDDWKIYVVSQAESDMLDQDVRSIGAGA